MGDTQEFVSGLRALADWYESHPEMPVPMYTPFNVWVDIHYSDPVEVKALIADFARKLPGKVSKESNEQTFKVSADFGGGITLGAGALRSVVCTPKQVGTRIIPATEAREVPIYEWDCDPILRGPHARG